MYMYLSIALQLLLGMFMGVNHKMCDMYTGATGCTMYSFAWSPDSGEVGTITSTNHNDTSITACTCHLLLVLLVLLVLLDA